DQIWKALAVQIAKHRPADQSYVFKRFCVCNILFPFFVYAPKESRGGRKRISAGYKSPTNEQLQAAITGKICKRKRADPGMFGDQALIDGLKFEIILAHSGTGSFTVLIVGTTNQDDWFISACMPTDDTRLIAFKHFGKRRRLQTFEPFPSPVQIN